MVRIFDIETGEVVHRFANIHKGNFLGNILFDSRKNFLEPVTTLAMSLDGKYLVSGSQDCSVRVFDFETRMSLHH